jgi:hypothetical protein
VDCRCTSITPGAPVKIAGAPGDARCALGMPGAPGIRVFDTGRTCHSQGAPVDRRWTSITPGASLEYQEHPGRREGLDLWISAAAQWEWGCSSRRRKTAPPHGCRVVVFPSPAPCAAGRLALSAGALEEIPPQKSAARVWVYLYQILNFDKFAKQLCSSSSPSVPHVSRTQPGPALGTTSRAQAAQGIGRWWVLTCDCGVRRWCVIQQNNYFEIRCHLNLLPT